MSASRPAQNFVTLTLTLTSGFSEHADIDFSLFMNGLKCGVTQFILDA